MIHSGPRDQTQGRRVRNFTRAPMRKGLKVAIFIRLSLGAKNRDLRILSQIVKVHKDIVL